MGNLTYRELRGKNLSTIIMKSFFINAILKIEMFPKG